jgi:hypothetical protein
LFLKTSPVKELEDYGFLKFNPKFKIANIYSPWLHSQVLKSLANEEMENKGLKLWINQIQKQAELIHQNSIENEMQRRKTNEENKKKIEKVLYFI